MFILVIDMAQNILGSKGECMTSPLLSIIVPNYNNELYVRDCIDSILNQTYKNIEIIVSDDASTDKSPAIILQYENLHGDIIKNIYNNVNQGVSSNRHSAILKARGEYITTIDSDDYYCDESKLEKEMSIVLEHREKYCRDVCAFSNILLITGDKELIQVVGTQETIREGLILEGIISRSCFIPRDYIMSKSAYFRVGGFDPSLKIYEDWDLKIRLAAEFPFYYTGINGIAYRRHGMGLSAASASEHLEAMSRIFDKNIKLVPLWRRRCIYNKFNKLIDALQSPTEKHNLTGELRVVNFLSRLIQLFHSKKQ